MHLVASYGVLNLHDGIRLGRMYLDRTADMIAIKYQKYMFTFLSFIELSVEYGYFYVCKLQLEYAESDKSGNAQIKDTFNTSKDLLCISIRTMNRV